MIDKSTATTSLIGLAIAQFLWACTSETVAPAPDDRAGRYVTFVADRDELDHHALYAVDREGDLVPFELPVDRRDAEPPLTAAEWSPDGRWLVGFGEELLVMDTDAGLRTHCRAERGAPHWSPNAQWLALHLNASNEVVVLEAQGCAERVRRSISSLATIVWSPTSDRLALVEHGTDHETPGNVHVVDLAGPDTTHPLTHTGSPDVRWSPGGNWLAIGEGGVDADSIWLVTDDGSRIDLDVASIQGAPQFVWASEHRLLVRDDVLVAHDVRTGQRTMLGDHYRPAVTPGAMLAFDANTIEVRPVDGDAIGEPARYAVPFEPNNVRFAGGPWHIIASDTEELWHLARASGRWTRIDGASPYPVMAPRTARFLDPEARPAQVEIFDVAGGWHLPLGEGLDGHLSSVVWSSDRTLAYTFDENVYLAQFDNQGNAAEPLLLHASQSTLRSVYHLGFQPERKP